MRNLGFGICGSTCSSCYGMGAMSLTQAEYKESHSLTAVSGPAALEESSGLGKESLTFLS